MESIIVELLKFGLTEKEAKIFIFLYQYGARPASIVARSIGDERTNTYKSLVGLVKKGFVSSSQKEGVKIFFVSNKDILKQKIELEEEQIKFKKKSLINLENNLEQLNKNSTKGKPGIVFFEGDDGIKNLYNDIIFQTSQKGYKIIKFFASNTLENKSGINFFENYPLFIEHIKAKNIKLETYLGNGISIFEEIIKVQNFEDIKDLPAGNSSTQIFISGDIVYLIIFKEIPYGIKISSGEYASIMHFLLNKVKLKN